MNKLFKGLAISGFVAVGGFNVIIPQAVRAGSVFARSEVSFENVTLELIDNDGSGDGIANVWNLAEVAVTAGGDVIPPPVGPTEARGPSSCPIFLETPLSLSNPLDTNAFGTASAGASIDCTTPQLSSNVFAEVDLSGSGPAQGNTESRYTLVVPTQSAFAVTQGDTLDLNGMVEASSEVTISGYELGDEKFGETDVQARYDVFLDEVLVFSGPDFFIEIDRKDLDGTVTDSILEVLDNIDYTFGSDGLARVDFLARVNTTARIRQGNDVPEPSTVLGLLGVMGVGIFSNRRRKKQ